MMTGYVSNHRARLGIIFRAFGQTIGTEEFILDTGYTGFLTLRSATVAALGLPFDRWIVANLADGSPIRVALHSGVILWMGAERPVDVLAMGGEPLLGTLLLDDCDVNIQFVENGLVTVTPRP